MGILAALALASVPLSELPPPQAKGPEIVIVTDRGPALERLPAKPDKAPEPVAKQAKGSQCIKTWTFANIAAHGADIASTRYALSKGYTEGNPMQRVLLGKRPSTGELLAFKAASIGLFQFGLSRLPNDKERCTALKVNTAITFGLSSLNWRAAF